MKVLSLFDGMSCGQIALERVGIKVDEYYASEIKTYGIAVTQHNYPKTIQLGDITKLEYNDGKLDNTEATYDVGVIDLLIGGSPCQNFSAACIPSKRLGLQGEKSSLFYEYLRILREVKPKYFLLENVASMDKKDQDAISEYLGIEPIRINSDKLSAQLRDRLYWTNLNVLPIETSISIRLEDILESGYSPRNKALCLLEGYSRPTKTPYRKMRRHAKSFNTLVFKDKEHHDACMKLYNLNFKNLKAREADILAEQLDLSIFEGVRDLNQVEMERLQTVPEGYTSVVSRNEAASLLGDGWTVNVIAHIFKNIEQ
ncbi:site-specific DNA-cytosine methylase [Psychrobacillus phage Perkons]|nr:site-specific DNA-cytosine methylase [Psychrobacillus phage Perkons]